MQTNSRTEVRKGGGAAALRYLAADGLGFGYFTGPSRRLHDAANARAILMADRGRVRVGKSVLELGCGDGRSALMLARRFGCRVTALDANPANLAAARNAVNQRDMEDRVTLLDRPVDDTGFGHATFDSVMASEPCRAVADKAALIREAARVLRPGGRLLLCDVVVLRPLEVGAKEERTQVVHWLRMLLGRARMVASASYASMCVDAGLEVKRVDDLTSKVLPTIECWKARAEEHRAQAIEALGEPRFREFLRACDRMDGLFRDGVLGYGLIAADKPSYLH